MNHQKPFVNWRNIAISQTLEIERILVSVQRAVNVTQLAIRTTGMAVAFALALFVPAGTLAWSAGWAYIVLFSAFSVGMAIWLSRFNPGLLTERLTGIGKSNQKTWDKFFIAIMAVIFFGWMAVMAFDAVRFRWSHVPRWLQWFGACILLISFFIFYVTSRENSYLSPAVRVQTERGQTVVSTGPYRYVRHPMYAGFLVFATGTALLLGSFYGLLGVPLLGAMIGWRAVREEQVLEDELKGYGQYMRRVRYRFVPHVW